MLQSPDHRGSPAHANSPGPISRRGFLALAGLGAAWGCGASTGIGPSSAAAGHLEVARGQKPAGPLHPGEQRLQLDGGRNGILYVPQGYQQGRAAPVAVMLHGAGGNAGGMAFTHRLGDEFGVIILAPESRGGTWDVILGGFGPDVEFITRAMNDLFARADVDPARVAVGGFSDGASYALSLGLGNGDLFTHLIAFSPGFVARATRRGKPRIFVSHGDADEVLPIDRTSRRIVPDLRAEGYDVTYREFAGPHSVPDPIAREAFGWFVA